MQCVQDHHNNMMQYSKDVNRVNFGDSDDKSKVDLNALLMQTLLKQN